MENAIIKWVTEEEVERLRKGARDTRYPIRNDFVSFPICETPLN